MSLYAMSNKSKCNYFITGISQSRLRLHLFLSQFKHVQMSLRAIAEVYRSKLNWVTPGDFNSLHPVRGGSQKLKAVERHLIMDT